MNGFRSDAEVSERYLEMARTMMLFGDIDLSENGRLEYFKGLYKRLNAFSKEDKQLGYLLDLIYIQGYSTEEIANKKFLCYSKRHLDRLKKDALVKFKKYLNDKPFK